jgi:hypothetical protein
MRAKGYVIEFYLDDMEYFAQHCRSFLAALTAPIAPNQTRVLKPPRRQTQNRAWASYFMTTREKLNLAGLALGVTATFAWIGLLGFALSRAIEWLL